MIHRTRLAVLGVLLLAAGPVVLADDVVHFTNGTFMKVQSYSVDGDMIKVVLGPDASMAFPKNLVESIERAGRTIYPQGPASGPANVVTSGGVGGQVSGVGPYVQTGEHQIPSRYRRNAGRGAGDAAKGEADGEEDPGPGIGEFQLPGRRGVLKTTGRREIPPGEGLVETESRTPSRVARPKVFTTIAPRAASQTPPTDPPAEPPPVETPDEGSPESDGATPPE